MREADGCGYHDDARGAIRDPSPRHILELRKAGWFHLDLPCESCSRRRWRAAFLFGGRKRMQLGMTCDERALEVAYERLLDFARYAERRIGLAEPYGLEQSASEPAVLEAQIERQEDRTQRPAH